MSVVDCVAVTGRLTVADQVAFGGDLSILAKTTGDVLSLVSIDSGVAFGFSLSASSFTKLGSAFSITGGVHAGSSISVEGEAISNLVLSLSATQGGANLSGRQSLMDFAELGSTMSVAGFARLGSSLSVTTNPAVGCSVVVDRDMTSSGPLSVFGSGYFGVSTSTNLNALLGTGLSALCKVTGGSLSILLGNAVTEYLLRVSYQSTASFKSAFCILSDAYIGGSFRSAGYAYVKESVTAAGSGIMQSNLSVASSQFIGGELSVFTSLDISRAVFNIRTVVKFALVDVPFHQPFCFGENLQSQNSLKMGRVSAT